MRKNKIEALEAVILAQALYYGQDMSDEQAELWARDLEDLELPAIEAAFRRLRLDPRRQPRVPLPAEVRASLGDTVSDEGLGVEVANRIWGVIGRKGFYWTHDPGWPACAERELGELAWEVVKRWGGWQSICQESNDAEPGVMRAQLRESAKSLIEQARKGSLHSAPSLPDGSRPSPQLESVSKFLPAWAGKSSTEPEPTHHRVKEARSHEKK